MEQGNKKITIDKYPLFKKPELLVENSRIDDLFNMTEQLDALQKTISGLPTQSILAIVGEYGAGKSTALYQLEKAKKKDELWLLFDAWKYPDRKELWEGFVLDVAEQLGKHKQVLRKIAGKGTSKGKVAIDILSDIAENLSGIPGFNVADKLLSLFKTSPATRVFEQQKTLVSLLDADIFKKIFIVIEDIDRSGDSGIYFLETLNHFIKNTKLEKKVSVIVPISNTSYYSNLDSYLKCIDFFHLFENNKRSYDVFVSEVFNPELFAGNITDSSVISRGNNRRIQTIQFLEMLFETYPADMNIRKLKMILREAELAYNAQRKDGHNPDWRITLCTQAMKYIRHNYRDDSDKRSVLDYARQASRISPTSLFSAMIFAVAQEASELYKEDYSNGGKKVLRQPGTNIKFVQRQNNDIAQYPSYPYPVDGWASDDGERHYYALCDFYLKY